MSRIVFVLTLAVASIAFGQQRGLRPSQQREDATARHVDSIAALQAIDDDEFLKDGEKVFVKGDRGGWFVYDDSSSSADNGFTFAATGTTDSTDRFIREYYTGNPVNVLWFGADRSGTTDSRAAIQAAIDAMPFGAVVHFPEGDYRCNTSVLINKSVKLVGFGTGNENNQTDGSRLFWGGAGAGTVVQINNGLAGTAVHGWSIENMTISGNSVTGSIGITVGPGSGSNRSTSGTLEKLYITACDDVGILCQNAQLGTWNHVHVNACQGQGVRFAYGANHGNTSQSINGLRVSRCGGEGIVIEHLTSSTFRNCYVELNDREGLLVDLNDAAARIECRFSPILGESNNQLSYAATFANGTDTFTATGHTYSNGDRITLQGTMPAGGNFVAGRGYFVINQVGNDFQLSETSSGSGS